jgi:hypothetical protein
MRMGKMKMSLYLLARRQSAVCRFLTRANAFLVEGF